MTVREYREQLRKQIKALDEFKPSTFVEYHDSFHSDLPDIDFDKMRYNEANAKTRYCAVDDDGNFASSYPDKAIVSNSIEELASSVAYYFRRSPFNLMVKDSGSKTWRSGTDYENKRFNKELDHAFSLDEWH